MGSGSGGWWGVGFLCKRREKGKGVGMTGKGTGKPMRTHLSKLPFSKLPISFSPRKQGFSDPCLDQQHAQDPD